MNILVALETTDKLTVTYLVPYMVKRWWAMCQIQMAKRWWISGWWENRGCRCSKQNLVVVLAVLQLLRRLCSVVSPWREVTHSFLTGLQSKVPQFAEHKNNARPLYPMSFCLPAKATYRKGEYLKRSQWFQAGSTFPVPQMHRCLIFGHGNGCLITSENSSLWCHGY